MTNIQIRHILYLMLVYCSVVESTQQHTQEKAAKSSEIHTGPVRLSQKVGYGTVAEVEPSPDIRIYVYNSKNSFNPTNQMFSNRTLRQLKNQRFKNQSQDIQSEFDQIKALEKRQLALIMDAIEKSSKNKK